MAVTVLYMCRVRSSEEERRMDRWRAEGLEEGIGSGAPNRACEGSQRSSEPGSYLRLIDLCITQLHSVDYEGLSPHQILGGTYSNLHHIIPQS